MRFQTLFRDKPQTPVVNRALVQPQAPTKKQKPRYDAPASVGNVSALHPVTQIIRTCGMISGVAPDELLSPSRLSRISAVRQIAMWLSYRTGRYSLKEIGRRFNRDHTTVLHAVRVIDRLMHDVVGIVPADRMPEYFERAFERWQERWDGKDVRPGRPSSHRVGFQPQQWHLDILSFLNERGERGASLNEILVAVRQPWDPRRVCGSSTPNERVRKVIETLAKHGKVRIVPHVLRGGQPPNMYFYLGGAE